LLYSIDSCFMIYVSIELFSFREKCFDFFVKLDFIFDDQNENKRIVFKLFVMKISVKLTRQE
jgi:hypothetical protein